MGLGILWVLCGWVFKKHGIRKRFGDFDRCGMKMMRFKANGERLRSRRRGRGAVKLVIIYYIRLCYTSI